MSCHKTVRARDPERRPTHATIVRTKTLDEALLLESMLIRKLRPAQNKVFDKFEIAT
jgi:hypothetical protein